MKGRVSVDLVTKYRVPHHVPLIASIGANLTLSKYFPFFRVMAALDENLIEKSEIVHLSLAMMTAVHTVCRIIPMMHWMRSRKTDAMQLVVITREPNPMVDMVSSCLTSSQGRRSSS